MGGFPLSAIMQCVMILTPPLSQEFLKQGEATSTRCDELESLRKRGCSSAKVENPRGSQRVLKDKVVTNRNKGEGKLRPEDITQIQPQKLTLSLRSGKNLHGTVTFDWVASQMEPFSLFSALLLALVKSSALC